MENESSNSLIFLKGLINEGLDPSLGFEEEAGLNSIDLIKLIVAIEEKFEIEFDDDSLSFTEIKCINDIESYLQKNVGQNYLNKE